MKDFAQDMGQPALRWNGSSFRFLIPSAETGGALSLTLVEGPALSGPPRHVHGAEDETFYILDGEVEFWVAGRLIRKGPGECAFVPRGTEHSFRTLTEARMLVALTPGGFEGFFAEMAQGGFRIPEDMPAVVESAARHNLTFTGPPL